MGNFPQTNKASIGSGARFIVSLALRVEDRRGRGDLHYSDATRRRYSRSEKLK